MRLVNRLPVTINVEQSRLDERLDIYLHAQLPDLSRGTIQRLIESGYIRVNGRHAKSTQSPKAGDRIDVTWPEPEPAGAKPEDIPLDVLYEDDDLLIINKPPGLVVHPAAGHAEHTLVNALLHHCRGALSGIGGVARPGIVHRLDKDTSGCLVVAKNDATHDALGRQFAGRETRKVYQAIVCGVLTAESGEIRAGIARHPNHRKRMAVSDGGRDAHTDYRVRGRWPLATWVEAVLHTGRTHQVRVHFHHLGHPLVGDTVYGRRANARLAEMTGYQAPRQMLHAWVLGLVHPRTDEPFEIEAPLPDDFREAIMRLRSAAA